MAKVKIEPSGCVIHKGKIQIRLSMYLDPIDPRYSEHHVYVVDETSQKWKNGYKGAKNPDGSPIQADYDAWIASLPHVWRDNPFNNHFIYVDADIPVADVKSQAQAYLNEFFTGWSEGKDMGAVWHSKPRPQFVSKTLTPMQLATVQTRLDQIKVMVI